MLVFYSARMNMEYCSKPKSLDEFITENECTMDAVSCAMAVRGGETMRCRYYLAAAALRGAETDTIQQLLPAAGQVGTDVSVRMSICYILVTCYKDLTLRILYLTILQDKSILTLLNRVIMSVCLCLCVSACLCLSVFLHACLPVCLDVCLDICLFVSLSVCLCFPVCFSLCVSVCLAVSVTVCLSFCCLSVCLSVSYDTVVNPFRQFQWSS